MQVLLQCSCVGDLLQASLRVCSMREVDALKPALAFLAHCLKLPVADAAAAEVQPFPEVAFLQSLCLPHLLVCMLLLSKMVLLLCSYKAVCTTSCWAHEAAS